MDDFNIDKAVAVEEKDGKPIISADAPFNVDNAVPNPPRSKGILDPQKGEVTIGEAPPVSLSYGQRTKTQEAGIEEMKKPIVRIGQMEQPSGPQLISGLADIGMATAMAYSGIGALTEIGAGDFAAGAKTLIGLGAGTALYGVINRYRPAITDFIGKYIKADTAPARDMADLMTTLAEFVVASFGFGAIEKGLNPIKPVDIARVHEALNKMDVPRQATFHPDEVKAILGEETKAKSPSIQIDPSMIEQVKAGNITPEINQKLSEVINAGGGIIPKSGMIQKGAGEIGAKVLINIPGGNIDTISTPLEGFTSDIVSQKIDEAVGRYIEKNGGEVLPGRPVYVTNTENGNVVNWAYKGHPLTDKIENISPEYIKAKIAETEKAFAQSRTPGEMAADALRQVENQPKGGGIIHDLTPAELAQAKKIDPDGVKGVNLNRDITVKDLQGNTKTYKKGESIFIYQDPKTGKAIVKDGSWGVLPNKSVQQIQQAGQPMGGGMPTGKEPLNSDERADFIKTLNLSSDKIDALKLGKHHLGVTNQQLAELMKKPYWSKIADIFKNPPPPPEIDPATGLPKEPNKYVIDRPVEFSFGKDDRATSESIRKEFSGLENEQIVRGNVLRDEIKNNLVETGKRLKKKNPGEWAKLEREGMQLYADTGGNMDVLRHVLTLADDAEEYPILAKYKKQIAAALNLSPDAISELQKGGVYYREAGEVSVKNNVIKETRENYVNRIWKEEPERDFIKTEAGGTIKRTTRHAKHRVFPTIIDGMIAGREPVTLDYADLLAISNEELARVNISRKLADTMTERGIAAWHKKDNIPEGWEQVGKMEKAVPIKDKDGNVVIGEDGNQVVARSIFTAPKGLANGLRAITEPNYIKMMSELRGLQKYQGAVKMVKLSLSFFHHLSLTAQLMYEGGVRVFLDTARMNALLDSAAFKEIELDATRNNLITAKVEENQDVLRKMVEKDDQDFYSKLSRFPVLKQIGGVAEANTKFLFGRLQRFYKVTDYGKICADWIAKHPDATNAEVKLAKQAIATHVNNVYGGLNWRAMGVTPSNLSSMRLLILAPDWTISNYELLKSAVSDPGVTGKLSRKHIITALVGGMIATELINKQLTGHFTDENKKGHQLEIQIAPNVYVSLLRGGIGDISKLGSMVVESGLPGVTRFLQGKLSPLWATLQGSLLGMKYSGVPIVRRGAGPLESTYDLLWYAASGMAPIPIGGTGVSDYIMNEKHKSLAAGAAIAVGLARYSKADDKKLLQNEKTKAQNKVYKLASEGKQALADQEAEKFNKKQMAAINSLAKEQGLDEAPSLEVIEKYFITNTQPKEITAPSKDVFAPNKKATDKKKGVHEWVPYGSKTSKRKKLKNTVLSSGIEEEYRKTFEDNQ